VNYWLVSDAMTGTNEDCTILETLKSCRMPATSVVTSTKLWHPLIKELRFPLRLNVSGHPIIVIISPRVPEGFGGVAIDGLESERKSLLTEENPVEVITTTLPLVGLTIYGDFTVTAQVVELVRRAAAIKVPSDRPVTGLDGVVENTSGDSIGKVGHV